ncbi:hypothetical protein KXX57_007917 [Aspergillus fumigatus]|nr:hypothetical protein KXX42_002511 [Aspergillus fumigatus]KAH1552252.1 hypothetical protein KXX57_007917 [Aspergillus fumigatus]KAH2305856.1 hypothetical protein KXV47_008212 [Aspergillus fumigatus]KAH2669446.1 hypothetical protein KXV32_004193 [Aspergillus fumigatus]KAH2916296.1 hypothetical protein KXW25_007988 [Aspergillus fumigatus]
MHQSMFMPLSFLVLAISALACTGHPGSHRWVSGATNKTTHDIHSDDADTGTALECRCGMAQFLTLPHANITPPSEARRCASYKLIDARGTNEPQGVSLMFYPLIHNILANVTGGVSLPVEYPAAPDQNTTTGERFVIETIGQGLRDCPNQKYSLFGYSQGATLMLNVLSELSDSALESIKSVIIVGNPYRLPGKTSNVNATAQHDERASVGMFAEHAIARNGTIPQLSAQIDRSGKVLDFCLQFARPTLPAPAKSLPTTFPTA